MNYDNYFSDKLLTSMVNVMQSNGGNHGKPNTGFHYSNGTMNITENKNFNITNNNNNNINNNDNNNIKQHSSRKFSLPTGNSYGNHKIPLDRMSSVASSQYTTANSVLKLVSDEDQVDARTKTKTWIFYCKLKWCWIALVLLLIITIAVLATFFVLERRSNHFTDVSFISFQFQLLLLVFLICYNKDRLLISAWISLILYILISGRFVKILSR